LTIPRRRKLLARRGKLTCYQCGSTDVHSINRGELVCNCCGTLYTNEFPDGVPGTTEPPVRFQAMIKERVIK